MNNPCARGLPITSLILLCCGWWAQLPAQDTPRWRTKTRVQSSFEFDDNIREAPGDSSSLLEDSSLRLIFHSKATRTSKQSRLALEYKGGLQTYLQNEIENKLVNEIKVGTHLNIGRLQFGARGNGRLKIYLNDVLDYASGNLEIFARRPTVGNLRAEIGLKADAISYQTHSIYNVRAAQIRGALARRIAHGLNLKLALARSTRFYDRFALAFESAVDNLQVTGTRQKDRSWQIRALATYSRGFLVNVNYEFQHLDSNSFGYAFHRHQLSVVFGVPLSRKTWLRGFAALQIKKYSEESLPIFPTDVDTERDESNFIIIDLSRDLTANLTAIARLATYSNESIIRDRFYRKSLLTLGFDFRL